MLGKLTARAQQLGVFLQKGEPFIFHVGGGNYLPTHFLQFGLMAEQFQLTWPTGHEQINHPLRFAYKMRRFGCQWIQPLCGPLRHFFTPHRGQRHASQTNPTLLKEMSASGGQ